VEPAPVPEGVVVVAGLVEVVVVREGDEEVVRVGVLVVIVIVVVHWDPEVVDVRVEEVVVRRVVEVVVRSVVEAAVPGWHWE
jgi:hypothetical protein